MNAVVFAYSIDSNLREHSVSRPYSEFQATISSDNRRTFHRVINSRAKVSGFQESEKINGRRSFRQPFILIIFI